MWGDGGYKDDSSICKAAVHSGAIKNKVGGIIDVIIDKGTSGYPGIN
jgi:hypothetical protein